MRIFRDLFNWDNEGRKSFAKMKLKRETNSKKQINSSQKRQQIFKQFATTSRKYLLMIIFIYLELGRVDGQDGSSELTPDKTVASVASRLKVRCTDDNLRLYPNATACADEREPESCRMVFTTPASSSPAARDPKCDNPLLKDLADQCRRTCAICCEDPSYACQNDESGIVNCNQNMEKCGMSEFSAMMIKFCPATCGLCLARKCWDQIEECESMKSLCTNEIYATFMEHQCARTCGKCKSPDVDSEDNSDDQTGSDEDQVMKVRKPGSGGEVRPDTKKEAIDNFVDSEETDETTSSDLDGTTSKPIKGKNRPPKRPKPDDDDDVEKCVDVLKNCRKNKKFCRHKSYIDMMRQNCARTCGFCKPKSEKAKHLKTTAAQRPAPARSIDPDCKDNHPFCKGWAANGYCESEEYTEDEKQDKCAKTCGYC